MGTRTRWIAACVIAVAVIAALVWAFQTGRKEQTLEAERERPVEAASRVSTTDGRISIKMTSAEAARNGIALSAMEPATRRQEVRGGAVVLSMQELNALRTSYVTAKAQLEKAEAALAVSDAEYNRLSALYKQDQNVSLKALQASEGNTRSDRITADAARDSLSLVESGVRQQWGPVIADWLFAGSSAFRRLVIQQDLLIQITPPPGVETAAPAVVGLELPGKTVPARLVSAFPRLDSRVQAPSYLYVTPNSRGLVAGMNLVALLPSGRPVRGVLIPRSAAVWWQGKAWLYVQTATDEFVQRMAPTDMPVENGWIAAEGFSPGERVVVRGAQQLLSEVFRSQIQMSEEAR